MFTYRLALAMGEADVEEFKARISEEQRRKWFAYYLLEPWGNEWLMAGRMTSLIRAGLVGKHDRHDEERFLPTYRPGQEYRSARPMSDEELARAFEALPGMRPIEASE